MGERKKSTEVNKAWRDELILLKDSQIEFRVEAVIKKAKDTRMDVHPAHLERFENSLQMYRAHKFQDCFNDLGKQYAFLHHLDAIEERFAWDTVVVMSSKAQVHFTQSLEDGKVINMYSTK